MMRKLLIGVALLGLAACGTSSGGSPNPLPPPIGPGDPGPGNAPPLIPLDGPIMYTCSNGQQIVVDIDGSNARVQIVGGPAMVLPGDGAGHYTNGRYGFRGGGASGQWEVGRAAPADCTGS